MCKQETVVLCESFCTFVALFFFFKLKTSSRKESSRERGGRPHADRHRRSGSLELMRGFRGEERLCFVRISCESRKSDKVFSVHESRVLVLSVIREKEREWVWVERERERNKSLLTFHLLLFFFCKNY